MPNFDFIFKKIFNFNTLRKLYVSLGIFIIILSIFFILKTNIKYGIDFTGGLVIHLEKSQNIKQINLILDNFFKKGDTSPKAINYSVIDDYEYFVLKIKEGDTFDIDDNFKASLENFLKNSDFKIIKFDLIGKSISQTFIKNVIFCILFALSAVFLYIFFTFNLKFGAAGTFGLLVNVFSILLFLILSNIELTLIIITAILTIIGYSINDTIVIFDRIRESVSLKFHQTKNKEILNITTNQVTKSISQKESINITIDSLKKVIKRSILTSFITLVASCSVFFIPSIDIHNFTKVIVFGIFFGTISSLFFATSFILIGRANLESFIKKREKDPMEYNN